MSVVLASIAQGFNIVVVRKQYKVLSYEGCLMNAPYLIIFVTGEKPKKFLLNQPLLNIGRESDNNLVLPYNIVSRHHGEFVFKANTWQYFDKGSTNGTFINGSKKMHALLQNGDELTIVGENEFYIKIVFYASDYKLESLSISQVPENKSQSNFTQEIIIGRGSKTDIRLRAPSVSRQHAIIKLIGKDYILEDLHSTNGTFVNGTEVRSPTNLKIGDKIQIGPFTLEVTVHGIRQAYLEQGLSIECVHVKKIVGRGSKTKQILHEITLSIQPGEFVALIGSSGAGKSTLLKILSGFIQSQGNIYIDGHNLIDTYHVYRGLIGYVPQDDIIHNNLTVYRALRYAA